MKRDLSSKGGEIVMLNKVVYKTQTLNDALLSM